MGFKIVGLDLSVTGTGVCILDASTKKWNTWQIGWGSKFGAITYRMKMVATKIARLVATENAAFYVEDYAYGVAPNASSLSTLSELGGMVKLVSLNMTGSDMTPIASSTVKKWLGSGKMKKEMMPVAIAKKYKMAIDLPTHDEFVAFVLADIGYHVGGWKPLRTLTKYEEEVVKMLQGKQSDIVQSIALAKAKFEVEK